MQKSAHIASIATRLNNLEQKFDEFDPGEGGDSNLEPHVRKLYDMLLGSSETSFPPSSDAFRNEFFFYGNPLPSTLYGLYHHNSHIYEAVAAVPFYNQVFGYSTDFTTKSLIATTLGQDGGKEYYLNRDKGFFDEVFGSVSDISIRKSEAYGESDAFFGTNTSILEILVKIRRDHEELKDKVEEEIGDRLTYITETLNSFDRRLRAIENKLN